MLPSVSDVTRILDPVRPVHGDGDCHWRHAAAGPARIRKRRLRKLRRRSPKARAYSRSL